MTLSEENKDLEGQKNANLEGEQKNQSKETKQDNLNPELEGLKNKNAELLAEIKKLKSKEKEKGTGLEQKDQELESLKTELESFKNQFEKERTARIVTDLEKSILESLDEAKINAKGKKLLVSTIKNSLDVDESGNFFANLGGKKVSASEYAKEIAKEYPEFIEGTFKGGTGTHATDGNTNSVRDLLKSGNFKGALDAKIKQTLGR